VLFHPDQEDENAQIDWFSRDSTTFIDIRLEREEQSRRNRDVELVEVR